MRFIKIDDSNMSLIADFCAIAGSSLESFRYFESRSIDTIRNHLVTYITLVDNKPVGYGHLDFEDGAVWLGVCIIDSAVGQGYGKEIMRTLISDALKNDVSEINLSVDEENIPAVTMYKNMRFVVSHASEGIYFMKLGLGEK